MDVERKSMKLELHCMLERDDTNKGRQRGWPPPAEQRGYYGIESCHRIKGEITVWKWKNGQESCFNYRDIFELWVLPWRDGEEIWK